MLGNNMFAYCGNNPIIHHDKNGEFPWLIFGIIVGAGVLGGIIGYSSEEKLGADSPDNMPTPRNELKHPSEITEADLVQPESAPEEPLSTNDRIHNAFLGATLGIAVGGLVVSGAGAVATIATGSAATYIPVLGVTAKQTFAIGALAYDVIAMLFAPLLGVEMETIEVEP